MKISKTGKKNFIIFSLVMMLGLIGYVNYNLNKQSLLQTSSELEQYRMTMLEESGVMMDLLEEELALLDSMEGVELDDLEVLEDIQEGNTQDDFDEAQIVDSRSFNEVTDLAQETNNRIAETITSKESMKSSIYFIESKLERDKKRSEMISHLNDMINNQLTSEDIRMQAESIKLEVIASTEKEVLIENMIIAKGFSDAIVYLTDNSINVVVNSQVLTEKDVAQIVDVIRRETNIGMDGITIMSKK
ncbi:SpoIIIAH-like family protein [Natronincola ferrireducens]|uniref:Stage III sporulation protein AH n=1 Tax=Natronincola ferrireducens TaxID=393762 RepID=A0A1G9CI18_9FIRM|nr:SpoIIIAH-like family protein [Natronincola ferrireducens]SDK51246.1 stage III sporulation protein AH [Natronincola ferrireducens]